MRGRLATLVIVCAIGSPVAAQWLKEPTKGIPRTADGKPNLSAPAPRASDGKPDLSGLWRFDAGAYGGNLLVDLKPADIQPWADALYKQRMEDLGKDDPSTFKCLPQGSAGRPTAQAAGRGSSRRRRSSPSSTRISATVRSSSTAVPFRAIRIRASWATPSADGRGTPWWSRASASKTRRGSISAAIPTPRSLRLVERFRRPDFGHIELKQTFEDPKVFTKPVTYRRQSRVRGGHRDARVRLQRERKGPRAPRRQGVGRQEERGEGRSRGAREDTSGAYEFRAPTIRTR